MKDLWSHDTKPRHSRLKLSASSPIQQSAVGTFSSLPLDLLYEFFDLLDLVSVLNLASSSKSLLALILGWAHGSQGDLPIERGVDTSESEFNFVWRSAFDRRNTVIAEAGGEGPASVTLAQDASCDVRVLLDRFGAYDGRQRMATQFGMWATEYMKDRGELDDSHEYMGTCSRCLRSVYGLAVPNSQYEFSYCLWAVKSEYLPGDTFYTCHNCLCSAFQS